MDNLKRPIFLDEKKFIARKGGYDETGSYN